MTTKTISQIKQQIQETAEAQGAMVLLAQEVRDNVWVVACARSHKRGYEEPATEFVVWSYTANRPGFNSGGYSRSLRECLKHWEKRTVRAIKDPDDNYSI